MSTSTFEEDFYDSPFRALPCPSPYLVEATETPRKPLFAPFEWDQIYRAWNLRLRAVRTRPCVPCIPYSESAPLSPSCTSPVVPVVPVVIADTRWSCDAETVVVCGDTPLVAWNESPQEAYAQWLVETARQAAEKALWRRPSVDPVAIVTPESFETCRVDPVSADKSLLSHIRLWENGTYRFTPVDVGRSPSVYLGLQERFVGMTPGDVDLSKIGFDLTRPFTICETPRAYTVTQDDLVCEFSRVGLINGIPYVERQEVPLSISFADLSFDVRFEAPVHDFIP